MRIKNYHIFTFEKDKAMKAKALWTSTVEDEVMLIKPAAPSVQQIEATIRDTPRVKATTQFDVSIPVFHLSEQR